MSSEALSVTAARPSSVARSTSLGARSLLLAAASLVAMLLTALVGLAVRDRVEVRLDDLVDLSDPGYPKQIDVYLVGLWALLTAALGTVLMRLPVTMRWAQAVASRALDRPGRVLAALALAAPIVPWFTGSPDAFPTAQLQASYATVLAVVGSLVVVVVARRRDLPAGPALVCLAVVTAALLGLLTATFDVLPRPGFLAGVTLFAAVVVGVTVLVSRTVEMTARSVLAGHVALPLLLLVFLAPRGPATPTALTVVVVAVVVALIVLAAGRARRMWNAATPAVLASATPAIMTAYLVGLGRLPQGGVPSDEYHWGEMLLQWPAVTEFGQRLFVGFVPAPGLNGVVYGAVNSVLAGDAVTFQRAVQVTLGAAGVALALLVCRLVGTTRALMLVPAMAAVAGGVLADRFTLIAPAAAALMLPGLWRRRGAWLGGWLVLCGACLLFMPGSGTAFIVASAPAAVVQVVGYARTVRTRPFAEHAVLVAGLVVTALLAPLILDVLRFVAAQGASNEVAWGLPILPDLTRVEAGFVAVLDVLRMSGWWLGLPLCVALLFVRGRRPRTQGLRLIVVSIVIFVIALTPYTFGRIEKSSLSRVGLASLLILGLLIPIAISGVRSRITGGFGRLCFRSLALFTAALAGLPGLLAAPGLSGFPAMTAPVVAGSELGLPGLGTGPAAQADSLRVRAQIVSDLGGGRPFLDLTSNSAYYYFSGVPTPIPVAALWNNASQADQQAAVDALAQNPPAVVFIGPIDPNDPPWWDPQLRGYRITRWLLENGYQAYEVSGMTVLLDSASLPALDLATADARLVSSYPRLAEQFAAWGANWPRLQDRFTVTPTSAEAAGTQVSVQWQAVQPRPDFLYVQLSCSGPGTATFAWPVKGGVAEVPIPVRDGSLLVPLGAYPSWHAAQGSSLTMTLPSGCTVDGQPQMARLVQ